MIQPLNQNKMKKTAVEQLIDFLEQNQYFIGNDLFQEFARVRKVNKQQIIEAREDGHDSTYAEYGENPTCHLWDSHETYYKETYGE